MAGLPPPPINDQPGSFTWLEWYRQLRNYISTSGSVPWYIINFTGSNLTDLAIKEHAALQGVQGGTAGEQYHLTLTQHTDLTDGGDSTSHYHSSDRDSANFGGTNWGDLTDGGASTLHYHASDRDSANFTGISWSDLTDGNDSTLHYHNSDRNSANFTGTNWGLLTGGTATTLHKHTHNSMDTLQGGTVNEYYHLTSIEQIALASSTQGTWTPTFTGLTEVPGTGAVTKTGRYSRIGRTIFYTISITCTGTATSASTAGTTYSNLPIAAAYNDTCSISNNTTNLTVGNGVLDATNDRCYPCSWTATGNTITISGKYEV